MMTDRNLFDRVKAVLNIEDILWIVLAMGGAWAVAAEDVFSFNSSLSKSEKSRRTTLSGSNVTEAHGPSGRERPPR